MGVKEKLGVGDGDTEGVIIGGVGEKLNIAKCTAPIGIF